MPLGGIFCSTAWVSTASWSDMDTKFSNPKDVIGSKKVPLRMVPGTALAHQAMAHMDGDFKYGPRNWRTAGVRASIYVDAALRHIEDWYDGHEEIPKDSVAHHLGHAIACLNIILDAMECGKLTDDRPVGGPVSSVYERLSKDVAKLAEKYASYKTPTVFSDPPEEDNK